MKIDNIDKGEIVYCNIEVNYERTNTKFKKPFVKILTKTIFARKYDCEEFPYLDVIKYAMFINQVDRKNSYYITKAKVVNLDILTRTGFINK